MWGKRGKRGKHRAGVPRQLSLGLLEDGMGRAEQQQEEEEAAAAGEAAEQAGRATAAPYLESVPPQVTPPEGVSLEPADVPVDNSTAPPAAAAVPPAQRQRRDERTGKSTGPGSLV
jgi:cell division septation protein DedD